MEVIRELIEALTTLLQKQMPDPEPRTGRSVYVLDGSSVQLEHYRPLAEQYPPPHHPLGRGHWPVVKLVVLHDARTGLAVGSAWGAMYGAQAVSEQALAERLLPNLPPDSVLLEDRNFGIFATAYAATREQRAVVVRLTQRRAQRLVGGRLQPGTDRPLVWQPSPWERKAHPELPPGAQVEGRLIVVERAGWREWMCLFTTLDLPVAEILQICGLRWKIETDLRSLKQTLRLHRLRVKSRDMMEKELWTTIAAYNLVRTVLWPAARQAGCDPRELSFSQGLYVVQAFLPDLLADPVSRKWRSQLQRLLEAVATCKLPQRKRQRNYPRAVWETRAPLPHSARSEGGAK